MENSAMLCIRLFHGRTNPDQDMDDWGFDGPVLDPYQFVHTTYASHVKLGKLDGNCDELLIYGDMLYYDDCYYGDWSVFGQGILRDGKYQLSKFEQLKASLSKS